MVASAVSSKSNNRIGVARISYDRELQVTLDRLSRLQAQVSHPRKTETSPANDRGSAAGFLAESDRMQLDVREYLSAHPTDLASTASQGTVP